MSIIDPIPAQAIIPFRKSNNGRRSAERLQRSALIYAAIAVLGILPILLNLAPGFQAAGLGLFLPGGGFAALGGWGWLGFAATLLLFAAGLIIWQKGDWAAMIMTDPEVPVGQGPILADCAYPDVLVAKAYSRGADLELVLYPGAAAGPREIGIARLEPGRLYRAGGADFTADASGQTRLTVDLQGRTALHIEPV